MQPNLTRLWSAQLYKEHKYITYCYGIKLPKPLIVITKATGYWGQCRIDDTYDTISISRHLILTHTWDIVVNVLKHEMAHQVVAHILRVRDTHGHFFMRACDMLGVPETFRHASGDLPRTLLASTDIPESSPHLKIIEKVEKLLSLSQSKNEHEAALAMQKANEMIRKYNLERIRENLKTDYVYRIICQKQKRLHTFQKDITHIMTTFFFVDIVLSDRFDAKTCETYRTIEVMGTPANVRIAEYVYFFLYRQVESLWQTYRKKSGCAGRQRNSYIRGILAGFRDKLTRMKYRQSQAHGDASAFASASASAAEKYLIPAADKALQQFVNKRFPKTSRSKGRTTLWQSAYEQGMQQGKQLTLHQGITENQGNLGKLLP